MTRMLSIERVAEYAEKVGLTYYYGYRGIDNKCFYICKHHGIIFKSPYDTKRGIGCLQCSRLNQRAKFVDSIESIQMEAEKVGLRYVDGFVNKRTTCLYECKIHGIIEMSPSVIHAGGTCIRCAAYERGIGFRTSMDQIIEWANNVNLTYIDGFTSVKRKCRYLCPTHGIIHKTPKSTKEGKRCKLCYPGGYDSTTIGYFYIVKINGNEKFIGYGITNSISSRIRMHNKNLKRIGSFIDNTITIEFNDGKIALYLETYIKKLYAEFRYQTNVDGFKTESVSYDMYDELLERILEWKYDKAV